MVFSPGARVEARYRGRDRWYAGVVVRSRLHGESYDIDYDDGETETHVDRELVRPLESRPSQNNVGSAVLPAGGGNPFGRKTRSDELSPPQSQGGNPFGRRGAGDGSSAPGGSVLPRNDAGSPPGANNPFGRRAGGGDDAGANINPFGRGGSRGGSREDRVSTAASAEISSRGSGAAPSASRASTAYGVPGLGSMTPPSYERRDIHTAGYADIGLQGLGPEIAPKSQLAVLKSSISNGSGMFMGGNGAKRRGSKERDEMAKADVVPQLQMNHSKSEQVFPNRGQARRVGGDAHVSSARDSENESNKTPRQEETTPRSTDNTPRRLDPLTRRRPGSGRDEHDLMPPERAPVVNRSLPPVSGVVATATPVLAPVEQAVVVEEFWTCMKCNKLNHYEDGKDYCDFCATRRGRSGNRAVTGQVLKSG